MKSIHDLTVALQEDIHTQLKMIVESKEDILSKYINSIFKIGEFIEASYRSKISYFEIKEIRVNSSMWSNDISIGGDLLCRRVNKNMRLSDEEIRMDFLNIKRKISAEELKLIKCVQKHKVKYTDKFLYIFQNEIQSIKIGQAADVENRRKSIEMQCGIEIKCINTVPKSAEYESKLHDYYSKYRGIGEWFDLPELEINKMININREGLDIMFNGEKIM